MGIVDGEGETLVAGFLTLVSGEKCWMLLSLDLNSDHAERDRSVGSEDGYGLGGDEEGFGKIKRESWGCLEC